MRTGHSFRVLLENGAKAETFATSRFFDNSENRLIRLEDGREFLVPRSSLIPQADGVYRLKMSPSDLERYALPAEPPRDVRPEKPVAQGERTREEKVIPVVEEQIGVERRKVSTGKVLIHKRVDAEDILVDEPVLHERYDIERVPVNRLIEQPVEPYYEGDTYVLPVLEEVVTVEKKLILREEVRVTRRRDTGRNPQNVSVRRERVEFERVPES